MLEKVNAFRELIPGKDFSEIGKTRNVAIGELILEGSSEAIIDYFISGNQAITAHGITSTILENQDTHEYILKPDSNMETHSEVLYLEYLIQSGIINRDSEGTITLFTELIPCKSCRDVIACF